MKAMIPLILLLLSAPVGGQDDGSLLATYDQSLREHAELVLTRSSLEAVLHPNLQVPWTPGSNLERLRSGVDLYNNVAPAVVVVQTSNAHGTGFLISSDGFVLTNQHVVSSGLWHEAEYSYARVHLGALGDDGVMRAEEAPLVAQLYEVDPDRDLALLKVSVGSRALPHLELAEGSASPGAVVAMIGHPASGMLWTYRTCNVSGVGAFPSDLVNMVIARLAASDAEREAVARMLESQPSRNVLLSSCQANPGDSGGPLVDSAGHVAAVTFAVPSEPTQDKFTYHVHLDEVRSFLEDRPTQGLLMVPDPWTLGPRVTLEQIDAGGRPDVLIAGTENARTLLFDLDNDTPQAELLELVSQRMWDFEWGIRVDIDGITTFYDRDGNGGHDLVLTTSGLEEKTNGSFSIDETGAWRFAPGGDSIWAETHFGDPAVAKRFSMIRPLLTRE